MTDKRYIVVMVRNMYQPDLNADGAPRVADIADSVEECMRRIDAEESGVYVLSHNEAGCPDYYIIEDYGLDIGDRYCYEDKSQYDWTDCQCSEGPEHACGECHDCYDMMIAQDIKLIKASAIEWSHPAG